MYCITPDKVFRISRPVRIRVQIVNRPLNQPRKPPIDVFLTPDPNHSTIRLPERGDSRRST